MREERISSFQSIFLDPPEKPGGFIFSSSPDKDEQAHLRLVILLFLLERWQPTNVFIALIYHATNYIHLEKREKHLAAWLGEKKEPSSLS